jgi:hypothetical protein
LIRGRRRHPTPAPESSIRAKAATVPLDSENVVKELEWLSDRISALLRTVAAGIIALVWGLLITEPRSLSFDRRWLVAVGLVSLLAMLVDLGQYAFGYANTAGYLHRLNKGEKIGGYSARDFLYRCGEN